MNIHTLVSSIHAQGVTKQKAQLALQRLDAGTGPEANFSVHTFDLINQCTLHRSKPIWQLLGHREQLLHASDSSCIAELVHPDDLPLVAHAYQGLWLLRGEQVITLDYRMVGGDGKWYWLRSQETILAESSQGLPQLILGLTTLGNATDPTQFTPLKNTVFQHSLESLIHYCSPTNFPSASAV